MAAGAAQELTGLIVSGQVGAKAKEIGADVATVATYGLTLYPGWPDPTAVVGLESERHDDRAKHLVAFKDLHQRLEALQTQVRTTPPEKFGAAGSHPLLQSLLDHVLPALLPLIIKALGG
jgi:hypothetical protein